MEGGEKEREGKKKKKGWKEIKIYNEFVGEIQVASRVCYFFFFLFFLPSFSSSSSATGYTARCMLCATFCVFIEACGNEKVERTCKEERDYRRHGSRAAPVHTRFVHHVENAAMALTLGTMLATMGTISRRRGEEEGT